LNRCDLFQGTDVLPADERISVFLRGNVTFTADVDLWAEALASDRRVHKSAFPYSATISVPTNNPFYVSPTGDGAPVFINYNFGHDLGPIELSTETVTGVFASGLAWHLGHEWNISAYVEYADVDAREDVDNLVDFGVLSLLLNDPQSTFDPYASTNPGYDVNFFRAESRFRADSGLTTGEVSANGPVLRLPGGSAKLTVGMQFRDEHLLTDSLSAAASSVFANPPVDSRSTFDRTVTSYFSELEIPLVGDANTLPGIKALVASAGVRRENYSDVGGVTIPQLGLSWSPLTSVRLRGTWSKSFVPPPLPNLSETGNLSALFQLPDPRSPNGMTTALVWTGGNSSLRAERAREWSFGLDLNPSALPVKFSATYFSIDFSDRILPTAFFASDLLTNPVDSFRVARNPTTEQIAAVCANSQFSGPQSACGTTSVGAIVDLRTLNAADLTTRGVDLGSRYTRQVGRGTFTAAVDGTYLLAYDLRNSPGGPILPLRNTAEEPLTLKARGSLDWQYGHFGTGLAANYASGYRDITSQPHRNVSSWTTVDVQFRWRLVEGSRGDDLDLRLDAQNVGNSAPPFYNNPSGVGYDPENGTLNGRILTARLEKRW
jgi:outer membrane receptor protein involved in Fe transport